MPSRRTRSHYTRSRYGHPCARCGKRFKMEAHLMSHMNQPWSNCATSWMNNITKISNSLKPQQRRTSSMKVATDHDIVMDFAHDDLTATSEDINFSNPSGTPTKNGVYTEIFPGAGATYGPGKTFMDIFDSDQYSHHREDNVYYPFSSKADWGLASWLLRSKLSMQSINEFLHLDLIRHLPISFRTAKELRSRAEILPQGPQWKCKPWATNHPTKLPVRLFYRDAIECLSALFSNPLFADHMQYHPFRVFKTAEKLVRVYGEWMSGNVAWEMQTQLPEGATILGTILSSDKTNISAMTGDRVAHPLLISLANIVADIRMKSSHNAFVLLALLPVAKFLHPTRKIRGVLADRLIHECLDFVLQPLKIGAAIGIMMSDPIGNRRFCFTPCAAYIVDTQEAIMLAGVAGKTSHLTMADYTKFGDPFQHPSRTAPITLNQRHIIRTNVDPSADIALYVREAMKYRLNGVDQLFWRDWPGAEPSTLFTPEPLHQWHKFYWDHEAKWCTRAVGPDEIDFRFSILPHRTGFRQFKEGISKLKQVTGREHRDTQRYMIAVIAGAVSREFVIAIRALMDFRYLGQAPFIDDDDCTKIENALQEFHDHKHAILDARARVGKGNKPIENWYIPKLELLQSVVASIRASGAPYQWSADITEHAHITEIKQPGKAGNNQDHDAQICRALDRTDKVRRFDLATYMRAAAVELGYHHKSPGQIQDDWADDEDYDADYIDRTSTLLAAIRPVSALGGTARCTMDYFRQADCLERGEIPNAPHPFRTFSVASTAFHLTRDPTYRQMSVDEASVIFELPDLRPALADYLQRAVNTSGSSLPLGGRRFAHPGCNLPVNSLQVWSKMRIQAKQYHEPENVTEPRTLLVSPRSDAWPCGQFDTVVVNVDPSKQWPYSGLTGHCVAQLRLIMRMQGSPSCSDRFLAYVQRFDVAQSVNANITRPDPATGLYALKRSLRADKSRLGDVIPLTQLRSAVQLVPRYGATADTRLTMQTSLEYSTEFWLNKYEDKEIFWALHTS